jgi:hypothetical protein
MTWTLVSQSCNRQVEAYLYASRWRKRAQSFEGNKQETDIVIRELIRQSYTTRATSRVIEASTSRFFVFVRPSN